MKFKLIIFALLINASIRAQVFQNLSLKAGGGLALQSKSTALPVDINDPVTGMVFGVEPEIIRFGSTKKMALSLDALFIQKGGTNTSYIFTYDQFGQIASTGSITFPCKIYYVSFTPNFKFEFLKVFYLKTGPRVDFNTGHNFSQLSPNITSPEANYSFEKMCYGFSYALGATFGKGDFRLLAELMGQNDLSESAKNSSTGQSFTNSLYCLNVGMVYMFK